MGVDLHLHSTASDGRFPPREVVRRAASAGITTLALTDHDTTDGVPDAAAAGADLGVRVIAGCEFSVQVPWGEMHLLGYFLPVGEPALERFLTGQRDLRATRITEMVRRLAAAGVVVREADIVVAAAGGALGRPHVARVLVTQGVVHDINEAFDRYLGLGRRAYVGKSLPALDRVTQLVRAVGGVTSAAHLKDRLSRSVLERLRLAGVDGVEARHPAHDDRTADRAEALALALGLLPTGGSDWHGEPAGENARPGLGDVSIPVSWLAALERVHTHRLQEVVP